jgi:predicted metal-dependent hydrolase
VILFKNGQFFAAHEVWEDLWRGTSPGSERLFYQGLVQAAVGMHHLSQGNLAGARAQLTKSLAKLEVGRPGSTPRDVSRIIRELRKTLENLDVSPTSMPGLQ